MYGSPLGGAYCGSHDCCREASPRVLGAGSPGVPPTTWQAMPHIAQQPPPQYHISPQPRSSEKQSLPCQFRVSLSSCPGSCKLAPDKVPGSCKLVQGLIALQGKVTREAGRCWSHVLPRRGGPSGPLPLLHPPASLRRGRVLSWESAIRSLLRVCKGSRSRKAQAEQGWVGIKAAACPPPQRFEKGRS